MTWKSIKLEKGEEIIKKHLTLSIFFYFIRNGTQIKRDRNNRISLCKMTNEIEKKERERISNQVLMIV